MTVKIGIDQAVSGLAINLIAAGAARYLSGIFFPPVGGDRTVSPPVETLPTFTVPVIAPFFQSIDEKNIFLISNISGLIYGITTDLSVVTVGLLLFVPLTSWILWRSKFGLRMRFSGENPMAPERTVVTKIIRGAFTPLARAALNESPVAFRLKPNTVLLSITQ